MKTNKNESSARQLKAAIGHFHKGDLDCAITLASAAEGILRDTDKPHLRQTLQERIPPSELNRVNNWLKHPTGEPEIGIYEPHAIAMIMRAITKFMAIYEPETTDEFEEFIRWGEHKGYWGKPR